MAKYSYYPQGYLPKIQYWSQQLAEAAYLGEESRIEQIKAKLDYFCEAQKKLKKKC